MLIRKKKQIMIDSQGIYDARDGAILSTIFSVSFSSKIIPVFIHSILTVSLSSVIFLRESLDLNAIPQLLVSGMTFMRAFYDVMREKMETCFVDVLLSKEMEGEEKSKFSSRSS